MIGDGSNTVSSSSERRRPSAVAQDRESVKENVADVHVLHRPIFPNSNHLSSGPVASLTSSCRGDSKLTHLMAPSISTPHVPHVITPRVYGAGGGGTGYSTIRGGDPFMDNQLPPNKRAARQATQKWTSQGNNDKLSALDQIMTLQQPPPPSIVERSSISNCTSGKGLESHCRTLMVLAEATSQFVESSRGDGEVPGFSEVSLSAQKLQEDIKRFIEHHQKETQHSNININMAQFPTNTELYTSSCTSSVQTCEVSTSTMSSKNGNFFPTSTYEEQDISNTTAIQSCAEQRSVKESQTFHGCRSSEDKVLKSLTDSSSFCAFSSRLCCSSTEPAKHSDIPLAPQLVDTLSVTLSTSSVTSGNSSSLQQLSHHPSSPLGTNSCSRGNSSSRSQSRASDSNPRTPGDSGIEPSCSSADSGASITKKAPFGNFKKKHEFWSHNLALLESKNSSPAIATTVSSSSTSCAAPPVVLDLGTPALGLDSSVHDCSFNSGNSSGVSTPKEQLSPLDQKPCPAPPVTTSSSSSNSSPKYLKRSSRSGTPVDKAQEKNSKRREERIRRLSMLLANDDTENKKSRERLKQLRVRFVEEVQRQTDATACSFNIIHSGQFMSSQVWSSCGSKSGATGASEDSECSKMRQQVKCDMMELKKNGYNFFPRLQHLFTYIINQAYHTHQLVSPRWKPFRGINLDVPCKVRLNNLIWRCWHLQFCRRKKHPMCRFVVPSTSPVVPQYGTHLLEGKYWRRQDSAIIAEYMSWRWFYKLKNSTTCKMKSDKLSKICDDKRRLVGLQFPKQHHNLPETYVGGSNADFIQSNLSQFHLVLPVDLLDIEPFQPKTPLNFDFLNDIERIELDLGETDTASSVSSNFFSPMQPEVEMSVEAVDSVKTIVSSTDESCLSASNPYEINDCSLSSASVPPSAQDCSSQHRIVSATSVLTGNGVLNDLEHASINANDVFNQSVVTVGVGETSPEDHGNITSSLVHKAFLNTHLQDRQSAASALSSDQLLCSSADSATTDAIDPTQLDSDSLTPVFLDSALNPSSYSRKRPLSSVDGFDLRSEQQHHQQHSLPRYHHSHVYAATAEASAMASSAVAVVSDCSRVVTAAASMHNRGGIVSGNNNVTFSSVPAVLHKSESIPNCCSAAAGYPSSANMAPLTLQRAVSASVIVSSAAASVMGESVLKQQRLLAHDAFDDEEVVEDESDEISESGSDSPNHHLLNSHQHHGQQQMVANSMVSPSMQQCAPTPVFTSLSNLAPVGVSRANDTSMANSKNIMSLPHAVTPIPVSQPNQMHGAPNIMPGHLNAMIAAYHPFSSMPNSASIIRGACAATSSNATGAQFLVNGQSTIVSSGSVVPAAFAQQQQSQVSSQSNGPTSPLALIMRHQQAVAQQHHSLHISPHQLQSPSLTGQRFSMGSGGEGGGGSGSSSVSPSEAAVAAATIVQNAPLLKGILGQVGSPGSMSSSGSGGGGRQSVSLPLMDKKMMENEEMKANLYDRIDPGVIKYQRLRDKTPEELTLHRERREKVHQISERKRRHNIQVALNNLAEKLPQNEEPTKQFKTRANILSRASSYIESLEDDRDNLRKNILQLREDLAKMNLEIQQLHLILPTDPSVMEERLTEQNCVIMEQQFHAYVTEKSQKEAPFFVFSHLAKRFFESFMGTVRLHNYEKFSESVLMWIQQHCNMVNIRAVVTESLTDLCVKEIPYAGNSAVSCLSASTSQQMMSEAQVAATVSSDGVSSFVSANSAASACSASSVTLPTSSY